MSVIVVGNGGSLLNQSNGEKIDSFDKVIRMGCFKTKGYEEYTGIKTDIWTNGVSVLKLHKHFKDVKGKNLWCMVPPDTYYIRVYPKTMIRKSKLNIHRYADIWLKTKYAGTQPTKKQHKKFLKKIQKNNDVKQITWSSLFKLIRSMKLIRHILPLATTYQDFVRPTLGICTVHEAINMYGKVHITGFDFFENGWYWDKEHTYTIYKHIPLLERVWFQKQINAGKIVVL